MSLVYRKGEVAICPYIICSTSRILRKRKLSKGVSDAESYELFAPTRAPGPENQDKTEVA